MDTEELKKWLADVRLEKESGHLETEHEIGAIEEVLRDLIAHRRAIKDVTKLRNELEADQSTVSAVSRAFANEIDRALKGQRG